MKVAVVAVNQIQMKINRKVDDIEHTRIQVAATAAVAAAVALAQVPVQVLVQAVLVAKAAKRCNLGPLWKMHQAFL